MDGLKDLVINGISAMAVIYGLIEAAKQAKWIKGDISPVYAIFIGVCLTFGNAYAQIPTALFVQGVSVGVLATWVYAGIKKRATDASK